MTALLIAIGLAATAHYLNGNVGINLSDEGYLWNGVLRMRRGQIPTRDFSSYEPGRYYWCAAWSPLFGSEILGLRRSLALCGALGLWAGLAAASRVVDSIPLLIVTGMLLAWWMQPRHKVFEHTVSLAAVYVAVRLLETPAPAWYLIAGVFVGLVAFVGRNHAVYCLASFAALIATLGLNGSAVPLLPAYAYFFGGVALGLSPTLIMWGLFPGMFRAWIRSFRYMLERGSANLRIPVPWPWKTTESIAPFSNRLSRTLFGLYFIAMPLFYGATAVWLLSQGSVREYPLLAASCAVGIPYMHHAFSRADLPHLCQGSQPLLLGMVGLAMTQSTSIAVMILSMLAISTYLTANPIVPLMARLDQRWKFVPFEIAGDEIWITRGLANSFKALKNFVADHFSPSDSIFIAPLRPMLYPILGLEPVLRNDLHTAAEDHATQQEMIEELNGENVRWALIQDIALDGRDDLRFRNTHALVWDFIDRHFAACPDAGFSNLGTMFKRVD